MSTKQNIKVNISLSLKCYSTDITNIIPIYCLDIVTAWYCLGEGIKRGIKKVNEKKEKKKGEKKEKKGPKKYKKV